MNNKFLIGLGATLLGLVGYVLSRSQARFIFPYLTNRSKDIKGDISERVVESTEMPFLLYLPKGYAESAKAYPVLYHLHGMSPAPWPITRRMLRLELNHIASVHEELVVKGEAAPKIIVVPYDGDGMSMWSDSADGRLTVETNVIKALIPHIDSTYRTIPTRESRTVQGFSMGGFGALKTGAKYPELFGNIISWDGALHTWDTISDSRPTIAARVFGDDKAYFDQFSPHYWLGENAETLRNHVSIQIVVGELADLNANLYQQAVRLDIPITLIETSCSHDIFCMMNATGGRPFQSSGQSVISA